MFQPADVDTDHGDSKIFSTSQAATFCAELRGMTRS
jgi:hypothetical protein